MRKACAVVLAMVMGSLAWGQLSPDEAAKRMAELNRRAAEHPVDVEKVNLVRENAELRKQVEALTDQVSKLRAQLAVVQAKKMAASKPSEKEIKKGMTVADAEQALGDTAKLLGADDNGIKRYSIDHVAGTEGDGQYMPMYVTHHLYTMSVQNGKIISYSMDVITERHAPSLIPRQ